MFGADINKCDSNPCVRVLISETALTATVQKDLLATDVKQVRGNSVPFTVKPSKRIIWFCLFKTVFMAIFSADYGNGRQYALNSYLRS